MLTLGACLELLCMPSVVIEWCFFFGGEWGDLVSLCGLWMNVSLPLSVFRLLRWSVFVVAINRNVEDGERNIISSDVDFWVEIQWVERCRKLGACLELLVRFQ